MANPPVKWNEKIEKTWPHGSGMMEVNINRRS